MGLFKRKRLVVAVALLLFVGGLLAFLLRPRADELARWKAERRTHGENFTLAEIAPKFSAEKQEFIKQLQSAANGLLAHPVAPGMIEMMKTNAPGYALVSWTRPFAAETSKTNVTWSALADQIAGSVNALSRLYELLRNMPAGSPCDYSDPANIGGTDLIAIRKSAQHLAIATVNDLNRGALDSALTHLHTLIALASLHEEEGSLVFQMIRSAIAGLGTSATWEALQAPGWDDARLAALDAAWARVELLGRMATAFEIERAWAVALYQIARTNIGGPSAIISGGASGGAKQVFEDNVYTPLWQEAWSKTDELLYLRAMQPYGEAIRMGVTNRSWQAMANRLRSAGDLALTNMTALDRFRYQFADMVPNWSKALKALMRQETHIQMARAAIALQRHRLRHGRAPSSLAGLVPEFLRETPVDYMTGRPLNYKLNSDGTFALYSAGENGRDDDGLGDDVAWPQPVRAKGQ